jgi:hypothetical protein
MGLLGRPQVIGDFLFRDILFNIGMLELLLGP